MKEKRNADKRTGKKKKKGNAKLLVGLLIGGGVLLSMCLCCTGVTVYFAASGGSGPGLFAKAPEVNPAKYDALDFEMTIAEVDAFLGGKGEKRDRNGVIDWMRKYPGENFTRNVPLQGDAFVIYRNSNRYLIVGFVPSPKYGELSVYKLRVEDHGGGNTTSAAMSVMGGIGPEAARDRVEEMKKTLADPKWKKGGRQKPIDRHLAARQRRLRIQERRRHGSIRHQRQHPPGP